MRLVDADNARECFGGDGVTGAVMKRMFDSLPTIDAVPVVRCLECIYATRPGDNIVYCDNFERDMMPDDYCSVGERKEADHG